MTPAETLLDEIARAHAQLHTQSALIDDLRHEVRLLSQSLHSIEQEHARAINQIKDQLRRELP